jgi:hypothetical protein
VLFQTNQHGVSLRFTIFLTLLSFQEEGKKAKPYLVKEKRTLAEKCDCLDAKAPDRKVFPGMQYDLIIAFPPFTFFSFSLSSTDTFIMSSFFVFYNFFCVFSFYSFNLETDYLKPLIRISALTPSEISGQSAIGVDLNTAALV